MVKQLGASIFAQILAGGIILSGCKGPENKEPVLFDPAKSTMEQVKCDPGDKVIISEGRVAVRFADNAASSVIEFSSPEGVWDGSGYRFIRGEVENTGQHPLLVELGTGGFDLTQGATIVPPGDKKVVTAVIYRTEHPAYIDSLFPVMHGKPDGTLRGWMATTCDSIPSIKLLFPELAPGSSASLGKIWLEEPYVLYSAEELKKMYYPFVDSFGQFLYDDWPGKIGSAEQMKEIHEREDNEIAKSGSPPQWDRYGGWAGGPQLEATGRFRVEKVDGKWWFVDPDGRLFWSHGMDCVEFGTQTRTRVSGREHYFNYLPPEGSPEASLYQVTESGGDAVRWLSFHALNLFRIYGEDWEQISNRRIHDRFAHWGMNTIGNWSDPAIYLRRRTPYVLTAYSKKTGLIADPYAPGFREELVSSLKARTEELGDPWCLGVFIDNELKWGVKWAPKIPEQIIKAPADQPAKNEFIRWLTVKYTTIDNLNTSWGTSFADWPFILENEHAIPAAREDLREFMIPFTRKYFSLCRDAVREVDPEMLYLGCRMDFHLYPEDTSLNDIIRIASEYCDVVSFNRYRYTCSELTPPDGGDYPIIIGEFHFGSLETGLLQPGLRYAADPDERALFYEHYVNSALKNPYMVGTHWFQLADQAVTGRPDGENYQAGFLTVGDSPQKEIIRVARETGRNTYELRSGIDESE